MFIHVLSDAKDLFRVVSKEKNIQPYLVEKDYWIMHALWGLKKQGFDFELKGGTSLSKGFKIIDRFSEDIDIKIKPQKFDNVKTGKNQNKTAHMASRRSFFEMLTKKISIPNMLAERDCSYDDDKMRSGGICLSYESFFDVPERIKPGILLEVGFDQTTPNEAVTIDSWALKKAKALGITVTDNSAEKIACYYPEYTFVEKLQAISTKVRKQQVSGEFKRNFLRHFYDIHMLWQKDRIRSFVGTEPYVKHKEHRFRQQDNLDLTVNLAFNLDKHEALFELYKQEYAKIQTLFMSGAPPAFEEIYASIVRLREMG